MWQNKVVHITTLEHELRRASSYVRMTTPQPFNVISNHTFCSFRAKTWRKIMPLGGSPESSSRIRLRGDPFYQKKVYPEGVLLLDKKSRYPQIFRCNRGNLQ